MEKTYNLKVTRDNMVTINRAIQIYSEVAKVTHRDKEISDFEYIEILTSVNDLLVAMRPTAQEIGADLKEEKENG